MGKYINKIRGKALGASFDEKKKALLEEGARSVSGDVFLGNMVCLVDNGHFAAAAYAYSEEEYEVFKTPDGRKKEWFVLDNVEKYAQ